jgi:hypothetical protein
MSAGLAKKEKKYFSLVLNNFLIYKEIILLSFLCVLSASAVRSFFRVFACR